MEASTLSALRSIFSDRLQENVPLSSYTAARIGGPADALVFVHSAEELAFTCEKLWEMDLPFILLGSGSNVLVSDKGVRGVVIINRARLVKFNVNKEPPTVFAESGVTPNDIAQRAERLGLAGFEWAASIPGTLGGAVYGNAGAFGGDIAGNLISVELLLRGSGRQVWPVSKMEYGYRTSILKRDHLPVIILSAELALRHGVSSEIRSQMEKNSEQRHKNQPPGASMGSMFKNPKDGKAGRLIEDAGLKGKRIGNAEISSQHANFFISNVPTRSADMRALLELAQQTVYDKFGVRLEPEIEIIGEW
jgi:UDP-N-acetylmuramate dehydrogenase